jgi:RNA polymerase sigma factor (sigma-70 family)
MVTEVTKDDETESTDRGGEAAFIAFYRREYPSAVRIADALVGRSASEDSVQDAFLRLRGRFAEFDNPAGYLHVVLVNRCRDELRRRTREADRLVRLLPVPDLATAPGTEILDLLAALPYRYRVVLVLRYLADWSETETAEALGCRPGTVKSRAARGLARLRKVIEA